MFEFVIGLALWSTTGVLCALFLRRQGHNVASYLGLGLLLGPIVLFVARRAGEVSRSIDLSAPDTRPARSGGWLDVLVGLDGGADELVSVGAALDLLRPAVRRLRFASVVDFETGNAPEQSVADERLTQYLRDASRSLEIGPAEQALLSGRADRALVDHAVAQGLDLIVVGHRRHRVRACLLGSNTARLARGATVPILIGPPASKGRTRKRREEAHVH